MQPLCLSFPISKGRRRIMPQYPLLKSDFREQLTNIPRKLLNYYDFSVYLLIKLEWKGYSRNKPQRQVSPSQIFEDASKATTPPGLCRKLWQPLNAAASLLPASLTTEIPPSPQFKQGPLTNYFQMLICSIPALTFSPPLRNPAGTNPAKGLETRVWGGLQVWCLQKFTCPSNVPISGEKWNYFPFAV